MRKRNFRVSSVKPGFTIIELLVVIVIIAVITALTMAVYTGIQSKVLDLSVTTDLDRLNSLEMNYKSNHGSVGKDYYSGNGPDSELGNFTPKNGNILDVVTNSTDYCIRGYNIHGTKDSIYNASLKETTVGACDVIPPSATAAATPSVPDAPVVTVVMDNGGIKATVTPVTCAVGTIQYSIRSRINDGSWGVYSDWSDLLESSQTADEGVKYGYQAQARCYISYKSTSGTPAQGVEGTYYNLLAPAQPSLSAVINGGNVDATVVPITCASGTIQYSFSNYINGGAWSAFSAWASTTTFSVLANGGEGVRYGFIVRARCYTSINAVSINSVSGEVDYNSPINAPAVPVLGTATTPGYQTTYSWAAVSCAAGTTARYQYKLTVAPSGFDSGWAATAGLSAVFTTSTGDQTYTVQTQGQCYSAYASSSWSASGTANYFCVSDANPIATSISGTWAVAPSGYFLEDGSAVSRTTYSDLFAAIGTTYGAGDGSTTFNLPDSRGRVAVNKNPADAEFDTMGEKYGEKSHLDTGAESGEKGHNHPQDAHSHQEQISSSNGYGGADGHAAGSGYSGATHAYSFSTLSTTATNQAISNTNATSSHNNIQPSIVITSAIKYRPSTNSNSMLPAATSISGYFTSAPVGYLLEDGSAVSRTTYSDLFAAIGTTYGVGDGSTTFNLPDSRGRVVVNKNLSDTEFDVIGEKYGEKAHLLTGTESGEKGHNHIQNAHSHTQIIMDYNGYGGADGQAAGSGREGATHGSWWTSAPTATNQAVPASNASATHNTIQPSIVKALAIKYTPALVSVDNTTKGTSISGYWSSAPTGYLIEDGSAVSRITYANLFATIGTTYGVGDGSTTFNLPDSRGRVAVNKNLSDTEFDVIGEKFGEKTHLLTSAESGIKGHNHIQDAHNHYETVSNSNGYGGADGHAAGSGYSGSNHGSWSTYSATATNQAVASSNAASPHNNIQPSIVQMFAIRY